MFCCFSVFPLPARCKSTYLWFYFYSSNKKRFFFLLFLSFLSVTCHTYVSFEFSFQFVCVTNFIVSPVPDNQTHSYASFTISLCMFFLNQFNIRQNTDNVSPQMIIIRLRVSARNSYLFLLPLLCEKKCLLFILRLVGQYHLIGVCSFLLFYSGITHKIDQHAVQNVRWVTPCKDSLRMK